MTDKDTDKELLKLAAKAAGIPLKDDFKERFEYYMADNLMWNPTQDDGDALRLAVKLGIDISQAQIDFFDKESKDPYAATRRAITRAAAEIGKATQ